MTLIDKIASSALGRQAPLLLIFAFLALLPFRRLFEIPLTLMALLGLIILVSRRASLWQRPGIRLFSLIFAAFWLPMLISLAGAINPEKTLSTTAAFFRLYLAGIFIIIALNSPVKSEKLLQLCAWMLLIWVADALLQIAVGYNSLGYTAPGGRINGLFGELRPELGVHLPVLAPLLLFYAHQHWPKVAQIIIFVAVALVVFMSGSRNGWIMFALVFAGLAAWMFWQDRKKALVWVALATVFTAATLAGAYLISPTVGAKVDNSLLAFRGDRESFDVATSRRVPIWNTATRMFADNPINGVGARGFRFAYRTYAADPENDPFLSDPDSPGAYHPHLLILEIGAETGVIGLFGFAGAWGILIMVWWRAGPARRQEMFPFALAVMVVFFPLNAHHALYASDWSAVCFWLTALFCATAGRTDTQPFIEVKFNG